MPLSSILFFCFILLNEDISSTLRVIKPEKERIIILCAGRNKNIRKGVDEKSLMNPLRK